MTLEEAIKHAEAAAIEDEKEAKRKREHWGWYYDSEARAWAIRAEENRQLADWLRELQERRKADSGIAKTIGEQEGEWIPVHPIHSDDPGAYMCSKCKLACGKSDHHRITIASSAERK